MIWTIIELKTSFMVLNNVTKFHIILIKNIGSLRAATVQLPHDPICILILPHYMYHDTFLPTKEP